MPVPKRKTSKIKKNLRRRHDVLKPRNLSICLNCGGLFESHQICNDCGFYNGKEVVKKKVKV